MFFFSNQNFRIYVTHRGASIPGVGTKKYFIPFEKRIKMLRRGSRAGLRAERDFPSSASQNLRAKPAVAPRAKYFFNFLEGYELFFCSHTWNRSTSVTLELPEILVEKENHLLFKKNCLSWWKCLVDPAVHVCSKVG